MSEHAAAPCAGIEIAAANSEILLGRGSAWCSTPMRSAVALGDTRFMLRVGLNFLRQDPHRDTGPPGFAGRAVGDVLRAAKAALRKQVVPTRGALSPTRCVKTLRSHCPDRYGHGRGSREERLRKNRVG